LAYKNIETEILKIIPQELKECLTSRLKSDMSEFDKIANYALEHPDVPFSEAFNDVRDNLGFRLILPSINIKNMPEVQAALKDKKVNLAVAKGLEKYSSDVILGIVQSLISKNSYFEVFRVNDYADCKGHAVIAEKDLWDLRVKAEDEAPIILESWKYRTLDSGYPAFQMNLTTPDGKVIELQIRFDEVHEYAEFEHFVYDLMTNKDIIGRHPELEPLLQPLSDVLDKMSMVEYKTCYLTYTQAQYHYRLLKSLGINIKEPRFEDYLNADGKPFDPRLSAENLKLLYDLVDAVKDEKSTKTAEQALEEYNRAIENSAKTQTNSPEQAGKSKRTVIESINDKLQIFKNSDGQKVFDKAAIETIRKDFNEQEQLILNDIIDKFIQKYNSITQEDIEKAEQNPFDVVSRDLRIIIKSAKSEDLQIIKEIMDFDSNPEFDYRKHAFDEPDNTDKVLPLFQGTSHETLEIMKLLMDISKEPGASDLLKNIDNIRDIAKTMVGKYSLSEIATIFRMKDENGAPLVNLQTYPNIYKDCNFSQITLEITPEKLQKTKELLTSRFQGEADETLFNQILSNIRDTKSNTVMEKALKLKSRVTDKYMLDLNSICAISTILKEKPEQVKNLNTLLENFTKGNPSKLNEHFRKILEVIDDNVAFYTILRLIIGTDSKNFWQLNLGKIADNFKNSPEPERLRELTKMLFFKSDKKNDIQRAILIANVTTKNEMDILEACLTQNKNHYIEIYKPGDIATILGQYMFYVQRYPKIDEHIINDMINSRIAADDYAN